MFKKILLAYDGSECAQHAADVAQELALKFAAEVLVLYAFHPIPRRWGDALADKAVEEENMEGKALIGGVIDRMREAGARVDGMVVEAVAHDAIIRQARMRQTDLIVIGSRGMGETTSYLMGTVSDKVVHRALCPVLVVR